VDFLTRALSDGSEESELPLSGSIELTLRCNVRCKHCYILYPGATDEEMSTEQVKRVLDKLAEKGVLFLLMTGGEILARCDFKDIYLHARRLGFILTLFTNGTLVTEEMADFLAKWPPRRIEITIYGHTEETYEKVTGVRGSFKRFRHGVHLLLDRKLPLALKTFIIKTIEHEFEDIRAWAEGLGTKFRYDAMVNPRLDGNLDVLSERVSAERYVELEGTDETHQKEYLRLRALAEKGNARGVTANGSAFRCGAGIKTFHVDPKGQLHPCMLWRSTPYNLLEEHVPGAWKHHLTALRSLRMPQETGCSSCSNNLSCGNCASTSFLETGVAGKNIPYYCGISKEKEKRFLEKTQETELAVKV
jgi:radical SAM protein with 4Fe4S-binding SPASM domain